MKIDSELRITEQVVAEILNSELDAVDVEFLNQSSRSVQVTATLPSRQNVCFVITTYQTITPRKANAIFERIWENTVTASPVIYSPTISERVAAMAQKAGISWVDASGNCYLKSTSPFIVISRGGRTGGPKSENRISNVFSPKSSRIIRLLLQHPDKEWTVQEIAEHEDVRVSLGLVSKVRQTLMEQAFIEETQSKTKLRDPKALMDAWQREYKGHQNHLQFFTLGDSDEIEKRIHKWCLRNSLICALSGFSAAWKLAPEVRNKVISLYVQPYSHFLALQSNLQAEEGIARVPTGANIQIWEPYDISVFSTLYYTNENAIAATSALQTWLDVSQMKGRGQEAALAIYKKHLQQVIDASASTINDE